MVHVEELPPSAAQETYEAFRRLRESFKAEEFDFVLFYGSPTSTETSWCPDCRPAHVDFLRFGKGYDGAAGFYTVPVGPREEFNRDNPFVKGPPHIAAVPTLAVYKNRLVLLQLVDPSFQDLEYFVEKYEL